MTTYIYREFCEWDCGQDDIVFATEDLALAEDDGPTPKQMLAKEVADVMDMWYDWNMMYPMSMTDTEIIDAMGERYLKLKRQMTRIINGEEGN